VRRSDVGPGKVASAREAGTPAARLPRVAPLPNPPLLDATGAWTRLPATATTL
jgi:hypothetical protein